MFGAGAAWGNVLLEEATPVLPIGPSDDLTQQAIDGWREFFDVRGKSWKDAKGARDTGSIYLTPYKTQQ